MPELPEVETIRLGLEKYLVGHKIEGVDVRLKKVVTGPSTSLRVNVRYATGAKVRKVRRFGKALSIDLNNGWSITAHIKLTGQLIYRSTTGSKSTTSTTGKEIAWDKVGGELPNKWTHVIFHLDKGSTLYYNDIRQFGWIRIVKTDQVEKLPFINELGPEPPVVRLSRAMGGQVPLTLEKFREILGKGRTKVKPLLMDQKKIGGVGNIYANDALSLAGINPRRPANSLSLSEQSKLYDAILEVLRCGLKYGGATEMNFVNVLGQPGGYQEHFLVYARGGEPCRKCGAAIKKIRLGGRGTYFCPVCQR